MPQIIATPKTDKLICHVSRDEKRVRFSKQDFSRWLLARKMHVSQIMHGVRKDLSGVERKALLGIGTKYELPRQMLVECDITSSYNTP